MHEKKRRTRTVTGQEKEIVLISRILRLLKVIPHDGKLRVLAYVQDAVAKDRGPCKPFAGPADGEVILPPPLRDVANG